MTPAHGPTFMGIDMVMVGSILSAVATFAVLLAIYAATTVRDPMAKRVKALNERREQLKAGIVASTSKRRRNISNRNEMADKVRNVLASMKMLQAEQVEKAQARLMQAGIRSKDMAFVVIFARFVLPVVLGGLALLLIYGIDYFPDWGPLKKYGFVAGASANQRIGQGQLQPFARIGLGLFGRRRLSGRPAVAFRLFLRRLSGNLFQFAEGEGGSAGAGACRDRQHERDGEHAAAKQPDAVVQAQHPSGLFAY